MVHSDVGLHQICHYFSTMPAITTLKTPLGEMLCGATDQGLCLFDFKYRKLIPANLARIEKLTGETFREEIHPLFPLVQEQIASYFEGTLSRFSIPLHLVGSPFQIRVWEALLAIPYGTTRSYEQQAIAIGSKESIRAVASANGENSIAVMVPCHRVIGKDGSLTGYGGGLPLKKKLLDLESKITGNAHQQSLF